LSLATAILTGDVAELPSRRDEDWRWTDLRGLIRQIPPRSPIYEGDFGIGPFNADWELIFANGGEYEPLEIDEDLSLALRFVSKEEGTSHASQFSIDVRPGRTLILLESYEGRATGYLASTDLYIRLGEGARLERVVLADDDADAVSVSSAEVVLSADAVFEQTVLTSGAKRQRIETRVTHPGHHAAVRMDGVYLLADKRHADITTVVVHDGVDGTTEQLTKGVVRDQARGIFQGRIVVAEGADRTDARMGHHALILSERAEVDAKPELLIYADDVQCAHGNTIGALDEAAIFYARQRGIPDAVARAMLTEAFVGEVIDRIGHEGAREAARAWAKERLG
jgi:Fe-S cluster assembly protein SufD